MRSIPSGSATVADLLLACAAACLWADAIASIGFAWFVIVLVALLGIGGLVSLSYWRPEWAARMLLWLPAHLLYRIRVFGREHVPATGPALLVCNHVSYVDAF